MLNCKDDAHKYLKKVSYGVKLTDLYEIKGSSYTNELGLFCPVFLEIKDTDLLQKINSE